MALRRRKDLINDPLTQSKLDPQQEQPAPTLRRSKAQALDWRAAEKGPVQLGELDTGGSYEENVPLSAAVSNLQQIRASKQPWHEQAGNFLGQAIVGEILGGTIEGLGYLGDVQGAYDVLTGQEKEFGNWFSDLGKGMREWSQEAMPIHQEAPGEWNPFDSGWWFGNGVSVASSLSMMIPSIGAVKALSVLGKGASKGMAMLTKGADIASKMGLKQKWITKGLAQAVTSRQIENLMEASGTYQDQFDKVLKETGDENLAKEMASEAASYNYSAGWAMLLQDIPQYLLIGKVFNPITGKVESKMAELASKGAKAKLGSKFAAGAGTMASEGFEEGYQFTIAEEAKHHADVMAGLEDESSFGERMSEYLATGEMWNSITFGALGGGLFQAVGSKLNDIMESADSKEFTRNYKTNQEYFVKQRAAQLNRMSDAIAAADATGDILKMETIRKQMNIEATLNALDIGKFDSHIETLNSMLQMDQEQLDQFGEGMNKDLIQRFVPGMLQEAEAIKKTYLGYRNNKIHPAVARKQTFNEHYIKAFEDVISQSKKNKAEIEKAIPRVNDMTSHGKEITTTKFNEMALRETNKRLKAQLSRKKTKNDKKYIEKEIANNEARIKKLNTKLADLKKNDSRTSTEKSSDIEIYQGFKAKQKELVRAGADIYQATNKINQYQQEIVALNEPKNQEKLIKNERDRHLASLKTVKDLEDAKKAVEQDDLFSPEEKNLRIQALDKRINTIKNQAKAEVQTKQKEQIISEGTQKTNDSKKNVATVDTKINHSDDVRETVQHADDPMGDEDYNFNINASRKIAKSTKIHTGAHNPRVLNTVGSKEFFVWMNNGKDKSGHKATYTLGEAVNGKLQEEALAAFKRGDKLDDNIYRYLPLKVVFESQGDTDLHSFINDGTANFGKEALEKFNKEDMRERINIINAMRRSPDMTVDTTIKFQSGGEVQNQVEKDEDGVAIGYVDSSIMDLQQMVGVDVKDIELGIADDKGNIVSSENIDKPHSTIDGKVIMNDLSDDSSHPYAPGALYLPVRNLNGKVFPYKLNLSKHTEEQADILSDMVISIGVERKYKLGEKISTTEFKDRVKEFPEEMKLLGKDATLHDFIDLFFYMSPKTKGKKSEIYISGKMIKFGGNLAVTEKNKTEAKAKVMDFLMNHKRRQFDQQKWKTGKGSTAYRNYMINNKVISHNGVTNGPLFVQSDKYSGSIYLNSVGAVADKEVKGMAGKLRAERAAKSQKEFEENPRRHPTNRNYFSANYYAEDGKVYTYYGMYADKVAKVVFDNYQSETEDNVKFTSPEEFNPKPKSATTTTETKVEKPTLIRSTEYLTDAQLRYYDAFTKEYNEGNKAPQEFIEGLNELKLGLNNSPTNKAQKRAIEAVINDLTKVVERKAQIKSAREAENEKKVVPSKPKKSVWELDREDALDLSEETSHVANNSEEGTIAELKSEVETNREKSTHQFQLTPGDFTREDLAGEEKVIPDNVKELTTQKPKEDKKKDDLTDDMFDDSNFSVDDAEFGFDEDSIIC